MVTTVYHGTTPHAVLALLPGSSDRFGGWLPVTDTRERALRYANAQRTRVVEAEYGRPLAPNAIVLTLETDEAITWRRRDEGHGSLDQCEATIRSWRVVGAEIGRSEHADASYKIDGRYLRVSEIVAAIGEHCPVTIVG